MSESVKEKTMKSRPYMNLSKYAKEWIDDFNKQEEEKQNISITQILEKINEIEDIDIQSKTKENGAFIFGFMKGYLHRGNEILGIIEKKE